jgi:hypothetical protein
MLDGVGPTGSLLIFASLSCGGVYAHAPTLNCHEISLDIKNHLGRQRAYIESGY